MKEPKDILIWLLSVALGISISVNFGLYNHIKRLTADYKETLKAYIELLKEHNQEIKEI